MTITRHNLTLDRGAEFSECGKYRYSLRYSFAGSILVAPPKPITFLMLNPSSADENAPDPTVRRCIGYAQAWGYSDLLVCNLFALRSTDPDALLTDADPVGPENDVTLASIPNGSPIISAWGSHKATKGRVARVVELLGRPLLCLKVSEKSGAPYHPLYLKADLCPQPWTPPQSFFGKWEKVIKELPR